MKSFLISILVIISIFLLSPLLTFAAADSETGVGQDITQGLEGLGTGAGFKKSTEPSGGLPQLIGRIINIFLSILGVLFVVLLVYGGYLWMTSFGREERVTKAKDLIADAVIGLIIILAAYAIANFVVSQLVKATMT